VDTVIVDDTDTSQPNCHISRAGRSTQLSVDQSGSGGRWVSLGTCHFLAMSDDYVALDDVTSEPDLTRLIASDAMKWEQR